MAKLPKLKKKINAFMVGEEGKISKESLLKAGTFIAFIALTSSINAAQAEAGVNHTNSLDVYHSDPTVTTTGTHSHHASHASHGSHSSHGSGGGM